MEYAVAWTAVKVLGLLPRPVARFVGARVAAIAYLLRTPLRRTAMLNLQLAFPNSSEGERRRIVRGMVRQIGWLAGEFSQFPKHTRQNIEQVVMLDGQENFDAGQRRGKGVLFLAGHFSAWELMSFSHALYGYPLHFLLRPQANGRGGGLINDYRSLSGNQP